MNKEAKLIDASWSLREILSSYNIIDSHDLEAIMDGRDPNGMKRFVPLADSIRITQESDVPDPTTEEKK